MTQIISASAMRVLCLALWAAIAGSSSRAGDTVSGALILNERGYWRTYQRFYCDRISAEALATDGERLLGTAWMERKKKQLSDAAKGKGNWMEMIDLPPRTWGHWVETSAPPPENWFAPEFDDSTWVKARNAAYGNSLRRLGSCLRARFEVPDPGKAGDLVLRLSYRGGVRVLINGQEIARGHLPEGTLAPTAFGADYPAEAYGLLKEEAPEEWQKVWDPQRPYFCPELPSRFNLATVHKNPDGSESDLRKVGRGVFSQATWSRVSALRNRALGPVTIPARLLRKGANVLCVELHASRLHPIVLAKDKRHNEWDWEQFIGGWCHQGLLSLELRGGGGIPSALARPEGVQVWVEDINYRLHAPEYLPPAEPRGEIRIAGLPNGTHAAQVVIGTSRNLPPPKITVVELKAAAGGAAISAASASVSFLRSMPLSELGPLVYSRGYNPPPSLSQMGIVGLARFGGDPSVAEIESVNPDLALELNCFDQLLSTPPSTIPAGTCQPAWISWKIPATTPPGKYKGAVRVEAQGAAPVDIPVEAEVLAWRVPDPADLQTVVAVEQSPYGVARKYKVDPWTEEHFTLLEASFKQLGRLGNDVLHIPVRCDTEFANEKDSPIKWIRRKDGSLDFDYKILDRYLDLAIRYWGTPRIIDFVVICGYDKEDIDLPLRIFDEREGKMKTVVPSPRAVSQNPYENTGSGLPEDEYRKLWHTFAKSLYKHMQSRGLEQSMCWGLVWDTEINPPFKLLLAEAVPQVLWMVAGHNPGVDHKFYKVRMTIYDNTRKGRRGWNLPMLHLSTPRWNNTIFCVNGDSPAISFRVAPDRPLYLGYSGTGRMAADYWGAMFHSGNKWIYSAGFSVGDLLWPGPRGAESSVRLESFLEGLQEAEIRIYLEQAIDRKLLPDDLAKRATQALDGQFARTSYMTPGSPSFPECEYSYGWQERSRNLFSLAAEAAALAPLGVDQSEVALSARPQEAARFTLKVLNWSGTARRWKATAGASWMTLDSAEGSVSGCQRINVQIAPGAVQDDKPAEGVLTITDVDSGKAFPVKVSVLPLKPTPVSPAAPPAK